MVTPVLYPTDIFNSERMTYPPRTPAFGFDSGSDAKGTLPTLTGKQPSRNVTHPVAGQLQLDAHAFSHVLLTDLHWQPAVTFSLYDPTPFKTISLNFMLAGQMDCRIQGLAQALPMRSQTHNFIHTPETGHLNQLIAGQTVRMLLIDVDADYYVNSIEQDDPWAEQLATDLLNERPVVGMAGAPPITPPMRRLIDLIQYNPAEGPMRNLLMQSRVLELLALQIEQFSRAEPVANAVPARDADKLYQLRAYLDSHFLEEHSLARLSRYCGLNEFKVKKGFKRLFNTTVFDYLRRQRLDYAGRLLRDDSRLVEEVAQTVGYEHAHHFAVAFKKHTGLLPSVYKAG